MYDVVNISRFIQELRKEHNFTQKYVAEKLNVSVQAVSKWETGKSCPDVDLYIPICELFGITVVELMKGHRINPEELKEETAETIVNVVSKSNEILKYAVITGIILIILIILCCMGFSVYKINANRLADLISFTYSDDKFKVNDLYLTISNDYKTQEYMGGTLTILDDSILNDIDEMSVLFCYEDEKCYKVFDKHVDRFNESYLFNILNIEDINEFNGSIISNLERFEDILFNIKVKIICKYINNAVSEYSLHLKFTYILHNHSDMFEI